MKRTRNWLALGAVLGILLSGCAGVGLSVSVGGPVVEGLSVDVSYFYDALDPYGEWFWSDAYGWVWRPAGVGPGWRPYTDGHWVYTRWGWTWVSDWAWGWAPFHYGRWAHHDHFGWIWVPGREWAPAWVAWRHADGWVGWAPLPPEARFRPGVGLDLGGLDLGVVLGGRGWTYVEERSFLDRRLDRQVVPEDRVPPRARHTRPESRYDVEDGWIAERGLVPESVEPGVGKPVPKVPIVDLDRPSRRAPRASEGEALPLFRPEVNDKPPAREPRTAKPKPKPPAKPDAEPREKPPGPGGGLHA